MATDGSSASGRVVPPGQQAQEELRVKHYGPIPKVPDPAAWEMMFGGDTADGEVHRVKLGELEDLERTQVTADLHCASGWSTQDVEWEGIPSRTLVERFPPARGSEFVIAYGQYGYSASLRLDDLLSPRTLVVTHHQGKPLQPEHGFPVRLIVPHLYSWKGPKWFRGWEYLDAPKRGFWEERGYHVHGDVWREERYSYQETHPQRPHHDDPPGV